MFKIGKYYKHTSGECIHIISAGKTTLRGWGLIAECTRHTDLRQVGSDDDNFVGWSEIYEGEWMENFNKKPN